MTEELNKKLNETIESQKEEIYRAHQGDEQLRQDHQLLHEQLLKQNWDLREAHEKSLSEMEELKRFQGSTFDTIARRKLVEDRDTILELTGKIQELQNDINCMNDSRDFQDAESVRSGHSHVASQPMSFPPHPIPEGLLSCSFGVPSRKEGPPRIWDTHGISGNVLANPVASLSAFPPQELHQWNSSIEEPFHSSTVEKSVRHEQDQDPRCQSEQSAKISVIFSGGDCRPTTTADFGSLFRQILCTSHVCLLKDKIQDSTPRYVFKFLRKLYNGSEKWRWFTQGVTYLGQVPLRPIFFST